MCNLLVHEFAQISENVNACTHGLMIFASINNGCNITNQYLQNIGRVYWHKVSHLHPLQPKTWVLKPCKK